MRRLALAVMTAALLPAAQQVRAQTTATSRAAGGFINAKTFFQTNVGYDPRVALGVDAVVVHMHGMPDDGLRRAVESWHSHGYPVGRMFFADSDATNEYWKGKFDGREHPDEVERSADGQPVLCSGIRPYMLPTEGWMRYLERLTLQSIAAGADAILPEEPLAHIHTGYEKAFAPLWEKRYGEPWQPESSSERARFLTGQLKNELYLALERRLGRLTKEKSQLPFVVPIHSMYSNICSGLVAPLGTSLGSEDFDGYVGQIWTGPVNWALAHYGSSDKSFFGSAYLLYDYFTELTVGTDRKLWLLIDPVEDDPNHKWSEFETWYKHCTVASLMFPGVSDFEVMPWPDRIFLPGFSTGGSTPAPESYRITILSAVQALQEVPAAGKWEAATEAPAENIGVAISDTAMWQNEPGPKLQKLYGMLMPLAQAGVPVSSCVAERAREAAYLARFRTIVLSYEAWKPADDRLHKPLDAWVRAGGSLVLLGAPATIEGEMWWGKAGFASPLHHLCSVLGIPVEIEGDVQVGKGHVLRRSVSPARFADPEVARATYFPLLDAALRKAGVNEGLRTSDGFCMRRGPFVAASALKGELRIPGTLLDVFDPELALHDGATLKKGESGLFRDVGQALQGEPCVLHATHRLVSQRADTYALRFIIRGPAETPAVARISTAGRKVAEITARTHEGAVIPADVAHEGRTLRVRFPNQPAGAEVVIRWEK